MASQEAPMRRHSESFREEYKDEYQKLARDKLFLARNSEGVPNSEFFKAARELDAEFGSCPDFVGITMRGSGVLGYNNEKEGSDLDFSVLFDSSKPQGTMEKLGVVWKKWEEAHPGKKIHLTPCDVSNQAIESEAAGADRKFFIEAFVGLVELGAGEKLTAYRKNAAAYVRTLEQEAREKLIERTVDALLTYEGNKFGTIEWRISDTGGTWDREAFFSARKKLWEARVKKIFTL